MKEAYVTFDTAELLKEKNFDWECRSYYEYFSSDVTLFQGMLPELSEAASNFNNKGSDICSRPTQQMALRWLREEYNILVTVQPCEVGAGVDDYTYIIYEIQPEDYHFKFIAQGRVQPVAYTMDYEGTLEEGIKHALINLI